MHFWIDKRSQGCGFYGHHRVPASLSSGRRRSKPMVTPVHRFQPIEGHARRNYSHGSYQRQASHVPHTPYTTQPPGLSNGVVMMAPPRQPNTVDLDSSVYSDQVETIPDANAQYMRAAYKYKYGMWAFFALGTLAVAYLWFYFENKGHRLGSLKLYLLGLLCLTMIGSCILSVCRSKAPQFPPTQSTPPPQMSGSDPEIPMTEHRDEVLLVVGNTTTQQPPAQTSTEDQDTPLPPPPPYHIAILLPPKDVDDTPPPSYDKVVR